MGLLDSLKGKKETYPPLSSDDPIAQRLAVYAPQLEELAGKTKDRLEAVPTDDGLYVYVGKPPKEFGLVWYRDGEEHNLMSFMKKQGLSLADIQRLSDELRDAYHSSEGDTRYAYSVRGRDVIVTPNPRLANAVEQIIHEAGA